MVRAAATAALAVLLGCTAATEPAPRCPASVDDGIACTVDRCDPATGAVSHVPDDAACPAGQTCSPALGCVAAAGGCDALPRVSGTGIRLEPLSLGAFATALVDLAAPPGDARRLFLVEQAGRIWLVLDGQRLAAPYLDLTDRVAYGGERGLLSLAFAPDFAASGRLYVNYTLLGSGDVRISELTAPDPGGTSADPASERVLLTVGHSTYPNHNGGRVVFGPDGWLYASVGDGGGAGDPLGSGQNTASNLGKLLRIDPANPAAAVPGNPFGTPVYHWGLRNAWRYSFDRLSGDLYIGDVGQDAWEEVDYLAAGAGPAPPAGLNWGWNVMEGDHCYGATTCNQAGLSLPVLEYDHSQGCAVTGGFVYRGPVMPDLAATGTYFYADYCGGWVRSFQIAGGAATNPTPRFSGLGNVTSFGEDGCGELYVVTTDGVSRLAPGP